MQWTMVRLHQIEIVLIPFTKCLQFIEVLTSKLTPTTADPVELFVRVPKPARRAPAHPSVQVLLRIRAAGLGTLS